MSRFDRFRLYLLPATAVIAFAISLSWGMHRLNIQRDMLHSSESTGSWLATQAEIERLKFLETLHRYANGNEAANHEELMLRFEIAQPKRSLESGRRYLARHRRAGDTPN